ncbi:MAG: tripartite tricarboxylate transporter TctB family protein [Hyphomicrobiales bacterium]|nr:tripartite tricarboxylate transporter TctB family protein [Hyphomicrobiales bacterium]
MTLNRWLGAAGVLAGTVFLLAIIPAQTEKVSYGALQPRTFPIVAAVLMMVFGLAQMIRPTGATTFEPAKAARAALIVAISIAAVPVMEYAGYMIAGPILVGVLMLFAGERRWPWIAAGVLIFPALIWVLFEIVLRRPLP